MTPAASTAPGAWDGIPGFVDLQVNGWLGTDFSSRSLTLAAAERAADALLSRGTVAFCPTVVTADEETYAHVLPVLSQLCARRPGQVLGIHLEGPFISKADGYRGAHCEAFCRAPDADASLLETLLRLGGGHVRILTLAPELPGARELAAAARARGLVVLAGHSAAAPGALATMAREGLLVGATHVGNGVPADVHRHNSFVTGALAEDALCATLICDGVHLPPHALRVALRAKRAPPHRHRASTAARGDGALNALCVSDAAPVAGLPAGRYGCFGGEVEVHVDGSVRVPGVADRFAGSGACMLDCARVLHALDELSEGELAHMLVTGPLRLLGIDLPALWGEGDPSARRVRYTAAGGFALEDTVEDASVL